MKLKLYPYKMGSGSAKDLARALKVLRIYPDKDYISKTNHIVINWGASQEPLWMKQHTKILNQPLSVTLATNKSKTFERLGRAGVPIPEITYSSNEAKEWLVANSETIVVCRTTLTGHSGQGIVLAKTPEEVIEAPLYTKHIKHDREFRVHVFFNDVIDFTEKKMRNGHDRPNPYIRNHGGGWVFCRQGIELPDKVRVAAIQAVSALGLDFGAVDIGYVSTEDSPYVFEVNTAPGLEGTTLVKYTEAFIDYLDCYRQDSVLSV